MSSAVNYRKDTKVYHLSTQPSSGVIQNIDQTFFSSVFYTIPFLDLSEEGIDHVEFSVPYVICPATMHNVNYTNNVLVLRTNPTDPTILSCVATLTFPEGNYNVNTLISKFNQLIQPYGSSSWSITFNSFNDTFSIHNTNYPFKFTVLATSTISTVMGFCFSGDIASTPDALGGYTANLPHTVNFLQIPRINLRCRQFAQSILVGATPDQTANDIIVSVPNNAPVNGKILYQNTAALTTQIDTPNIHSFQINLTDDAGNLINFNGAHSYFAFQFDIYRNIPEEPPPKFRHLLEKMLYHIH